MTEISDELIDKHAAKIRELEDKLEALPDYTEKAELVAFVNEWHAKMYADLIEAGGPVVAARDGTPKDPPKPDPK